MASVDRTTLVGSWKLVSAVGKMSDTGEIVHLLGPNPLGFCMFDANGRWMVVTSASLLPILTNDADRAEWFSRRLVAFSGRFDLSQNSIVVSVDVAWNPALVGATMTRVVEMDRERMTLIQPEWEHPFFPGRKMIGIVTWHREQ
jgi:hypothetical protein